MSKASLQLTNWLSEDIEIAQAHAVAEPPSSQFRLLVEGLTKVSKKETDEYTAIKLLGIVQVILSGGYRFFREDELSVRFQELLAFSQSEVGRELSERAVTVAALLLNQMREGRGCLPASTRKLLKNASKNTESSTEIATISAMLERIKIATTRMRRKGLHKRVKFKIPDLDIQCAAKNVSEDILGDWYQDPWGWPEVAWLGSSHPKKVVDRLRSEKSGWAAAIDVSKGAGGVRPGIILNALDRVAYQALVDELSVEATGNLPSWVYGWRLSDSKKAKGVYKSNHVEWKLFSRRVKERSTKLKFTAHLDVQSFFTTVDTSLLLSQLGRRYRNAAVLDRLESYFDAWHQRPNGLGIPQRSMASSVLSHAVLRPVDVFLERMSKGEGSGRFAVSRWMDDIWIHSDHSGVLETCVSEIEGILSHSRLSLNSEKTEVFEGRNSSKIVKLEDTYDQEEDESPTLDELLTQTEGAPASQIGQAVKKMLRSADFSSVSKISHETFLEFSYLGSRLAKVFRASGDWRRFSGTYLNFARQHISGENLTVANLGEMFPNTPENEVKMVHDYFSNQITSALQRLLTPLAAQRLAAWQLKFGAGSLVESDTLGKVRDLDDVFRLRGVCFASLMAGVAKEEVGSAILEADDGLISDYLKDRAFEAPSLSPRFERE